MFLSGLLYRKARTYLSKENPPTKDNPKYIVDHSTRRVKVYVEDGAWYVAEHDIVKLPDGKSYWNYKIQRLYQDLTLTMVRSGKYPTSFIK